MEKYFNLIIQNPTLTLSGLTAIYVFLTFMILNQMRKELDEFRRPYIQIRSYMRDRAMECLLIKNVGHTVADDVKFILDKDFFQHGDRNRNIKELPIFTDGIKSVPPQMEYYIDLALYQHFFSEDRDENIIPTSFTITCTYSYKNYFFRKKRVKEKTTIDIESTEKTTLPPGDVPYELNKISEELSKLIALLNRRLKS